MNSHARDFRREELDKTIHFLAEYMRKNQVDIAALQECGQTSEAAHWQGEIPAGYHPCNSGIALKEDNAASLLAGVLAEAGQPYHWTWGGLSLIHI